MIITCKVCNGSGRICNPVFQMINTVCSACKGAGEFEIEAPPDKLVTCKFCNGNGKTYTNMSNLMINVMNTCPACKGLGVMLRPTVFLESPSQNQIEATPAPRLSNYDYDVTVSFAGEDRAIVEEYCNILLSKGLKVFYDKNEQVALWGKNLYDQLDDIYRKQALFCVQFISENYAKKVWTNHERQSAQARALEENREYVLPVRLDDTEIPGLTKTIGYIDLKTTSIDELAEMTILKVSDIKNLKFHI
jgi:hypothetical protein